MNPEKPNSAVPDAFRTEGNVPEVYEFRQSVQKSTAIKPEGVKGTESSAESDSERAQQVLEKLKAAVPPATPPAPYQAKMNKERAAFARQAQYRAEERNRNRKWYEKLLGIRKVTPETITQEDAQETYTEISDFKRHPDLFRDGHSGPTHNTMAIAEHRGASESELSQIVDKTHHSHSFRHDENQSPYRHGAELDENHVKWEIDSRRKLGLPTDILNRDIDFNQAQKWEQEQREQKESELKKKKAA